MRSPHFLPKHPMLYSAKSFRRAAAKPTHLGRCCALEEMRAVEGAYRANGSVERVEVSMLVDTSDGVIADAKFCVFGFPELVAIAELVCSALVRKSYDQARRMSSEYIEKLLEEKGERVTPSHYTSMNMVLDAVLEAAVACSDLPCASYYETTPVDGSTFDEGPYPAWDAIAHEEKVRLITDVLDKDIRPYIELDAGGIEVVELKNEIELVIAYQGACVSCPSAIGGTLEAITRILRAKIHPHLQVTPDASFLALE